MRRWLVWLIVIVVNVAVLGGLGYAMLDLKEDLAAAQASEAKMREAMRTAIIRARNLEDERGRLQAQVAQAAGVIQALKVDLETKVAALGQLEAEVRRMEAEFNRRLAEQGEGSAGQREKMRKLAEEVERLTATLEKWKTAYQEAANVARAKEAERARLASENQALDQRAASCETKNAALFMVGGEILDRYAGVGPGDSLAVREPFIGVKRVELQNLVQDYRDKLLDQRVAR